MHSPLFVGVLCLSLFCYALLCIHSSFAIILKRKRKLVALLLLSYRCIVTINVLWLFLMVPRVGLRCVIVVFPDHTHLHFVVTCWERADLLALLFVMFSCVFVTFPYGILGQVWYFIVWIPDLCPLPYFVLPITPATNRASTSSSSFPATAC